MAAEFLALLEQLEHFFADETAAVSVETERFGTLSRDDVARLLPLARRAVAHRARPADWVGAPEGMVGFASERQARAYARRCSRDGVPDLVVLPALTVALARPEWYSEAARHSGQSSRRWEWVVLQAPSLPADLEPRAAEPDTAELDSVDAADLYYSRLLGY